MLTKLSLTCCIRLSTSEISVWIGETSAAFFRRLRSISANLQAWARSPKCMSSLGIPWSSCTFSGVLSESFMSPMRRSAQVFSTCVRAWEIFSERLELSCSKARILASATFRPVRAMQPAKQPPPCSRLEGSAAARLSAPLRSERSCGSSTSFCRGSACVVLCTSLQELSIVPALSRTCVVSWDSKSQDASFNAAAAISSRRSLDTVGGYEQKSNKMPREAAWNNEDT
mmetsp:Transcript_144283/g.254377  ORF Transcript_144283/g.254377 Transcript_144283/m.254377 type:complete len:228 (+) Transcript_144283:614-1297(+)